MLRRVVALAARRLSSDAAAASPARASARESTTTRAIGAACLGSAAAYTAYLSWWQLDRREWKVALVAERTQRLEARGVPLASLVPTDATPDAETDLSSEASRTRAHPSASVRLT